MSGLAEKVKEKFRGRSRSRSRSKRYSHEVDEPVPAVPEVPPVRASQTFSDGRISSPTVPAWHVHTGSRTSRDIQDSPAASRPATGQYENTDRSRGYNHPEMPYSYRHQRNTPSESLPARNSSLPQGTDMNDQRQAEAPIGDALQYPYTVPRRKESLPQNRASKRMSTERRRSPQQQRNLEQEPQFDQNGVVHPAHPTTVDQTRTSTDNTRTSVELPERPAGGPLGTEIDQALASLHVADSVVDGRNQPVNETARTSSQVLEGNEHVRIPQGFDLGKSVHTTIDTQWKPAVTHENVYHEKTEIVQEAITRDIHVHHYYTYVQPIKVVEVLPAKHYIIDEHTGMKVEIEAPPGWVMPQDLRPRVEDTSNLKGWTRHYLVNDQYPYGIAEPDPQTIPRKPVHWHTQPHGTAGEYMEQ